MIERMIEFNLSLEEYCSMFKTDNLRAVRVSSMIYDVLSIKKGVCQNGIKAVYEVLEKKLKIYYKEYNISEIEMLKDKMYMNKLKNYIQDHKKSCIEMFFDNVDMAISKIKK